MIQFLKNGKNYYPQKFPEECKYKFKEKTRIKCTTEDLTDSDSHSENNDGSELDPKKMMKYDIKNMFDFFLICKYNIKFIC